MATNITVTIDAQGNITCSEPTVGKGNDITWSVTGGTISSITQGTAFSAPPTNDGRGNWSAKVETLQIGQQTYSISGWTSGGLQTKAKTPKITVRAV